MGDGPGELDFPLTKHRLAGMGCLDNLIQSECFPPPFKYI